MKADSKRRRLQFWLRGAFFLLFVLAPPLDLFRFDLTRAHAVFFGVPWTLGVDGYMAGTVGEWEIVFNFLLRGFLPLFGTGALLIYISWRYGRLYCGWLCPHFSVVEIVNGLMRRTFGRLNLWEKTAIPEKDPDGRTIHPDKRWWPLTLVAIISFGFVWAIVLLTYLLPPSEVYGNLFRGTLTRNQAVFLSVGTLVFSLEFLLARHLFCRFGCAVGLFQSLAWMANRRAMVVDFDASRARACSDCHNACENTCPMRLKPRNLKRHMFTCTQCAQCISACEATQEGNLQGTLLQWSGAGNLSKKSLRGRKADKETHQGEQNEIGEHA